MSGASFQDVSSFGMLKELYDDEVYFQENINSSLYNFIGHASSDDVEFDGAGWKVGLKLQLNESYGAINDGERLPESEITKGIFATYNVKRMYSTIEASQFAATRGHKNGRPNGKYMDDLVKGTLISFLSNLDFDLYANGRGQRAVVQTAVPGAASFVVESSMRLRPGMKLDWWNSSFTTKRGTIRISEKSIDRKAKAVYIDSTFGTGQVPAGATAGDRITVYGSIDANEPSDGRHLAGLDRITDNTVALGGWTSADYAAWSAVNTNASGANPSQELLQLQWDHMYQISGKYPNRMAFNPAWKRGYLAPFLNQRRFASNSFETGATKLSFDPLKMGTDEKKAKPVAFEMLEDKNCEATTVYIWEDSAVKLATDYSDTPHLADEDGSEFRIRDGYDVVSGFYRYWANTVVYQRNCVGKIYGHGQLSGVL